MTDPGESGMAMMLTAYEGLTDHGLALPLFGTSPAANALHVALPSRPGDPTTDIRAFELYSTTGAKALEASQFRSASRGETWVDVFLWGNNVHVGTRAELWETTGPWHEEMERTSPLSLLALAEGYDRSEAARCAALAHEWLTRGWGSSRADRWRLGSYLMRTARRDLVRRYNAGPAAIKVAKVLDTMRLVHHESVLEVRLPRLLEFKLQDLPDLSFATNAVGWRLKLVLEDLGEAATPLEALAPARTMVMRLRHGRGRTQTQIPLRVVDGFFSESRTLQNAKTGRERTMTLSRKADQARNTMKLQLPEIAKMADPVALFERRNDGVTFMVHDASSREGRKIAKLLDEGVRDGSTRKTQGGATWWRVLPQTKLT